MGAFSRLLAQEGVTPAAPAAGPATPAPVGMAAGRPFTELAASEGVGPSFPGEPGGVATRLQPADEQRFQSWYRDRATRLGLDLNPDDPLHHYDYRAAFQAGAEPGPDGHWPSTFKEAGHPNRYVGGEDTITGRPFSSLLHQESQAPPSVPASIDHPWPATVKPFGGALGPTATRMLEPDAPRFSPEEIPNPVLRTGANIPQSALELARSASPPEMARALEHPVDLAKGVADWVWRSVRSTGNSAVATLAQVFSPRLHEILAQHGVSEQEFNDLFTNDPVGTVAGLLAPIEAAGHLPKVAERFRQVSTPKMEQAPPGPPPVVPREGAPAGVPEAAPAPVPGLIRPRGEISQVLAAPVLDHIPETRTMAQPEGGASSVRTSESVAPAAVPATVQQASAAPVPEVAAPPAPSAQGPVFAGAMMGAKGKIIDLYDLAPGVAPEITTRSKVTGDTLRKAGYEVQPTPEQLKAALQENARKSGKIPLATKGLAPYVSANADRIPWDELQGPPVLPLRDQAADGRPVDMRAVSEGGVDEGHGRPGMESETPRAEARLLPPEQRGEGRQSAQFLREKSGQAGTSGSVLPEGAPGEARRQERITSGGSERADRQVEELRAVRGVSPEDAGPSRGLPEAARREVAVPEVPQGGTHIPEGVGDRNVFTSPDQAETARSVVRAKAKKAGPQIYSGIDVGRVKELIELAKFTGEALARKSKEGRAVFSQWARSMREEMRGLGNVQLTRSHLERLWKSDEVRATSNLHRSALKTPPWEPPRPQGKQRVMMRERGAMGGVAYDIVRRGQERINLGLRLLDEDSKRQYKGVSQKGKDALVVTLAGIPGKTGEAYRYGAIAKAGVEKAYAGKTRILPKAGTILPDGRFVGFDRADGKSAQTYRVLWGDEARARHEELIRDHPEAAKVLDQILAREEPPIITVMGDELPSRSRSIAKERFKIKGMTEEEALDAHALAIKAYGDGPSTETIPNEFSYIPEAYTHAASTVSGRVRNAMKAKVAAVRRNKTGAIAEAVRRGEAKLDIQKGFRNARQALHVQEVTDSVARDLLMILPEKITAEDKAAAKEHPGGLVGYLESQKYRVFSRTGLYGESAKFRAFVLRNKEFFEEAGIDIPNTVEASHLAGGKALKIPSVVVDMLAPGFVEKSGSVDPRHREFHQSLQRVAGNMVGAVNVWRLTAPATGNRNIIGNEMLFASKLLRDFYEEAVSHVLDKETRVAPFVRTLADIRAIGTALTKETRNRIPREMLGSTWLDEAEKSGGIARAGGFVLRKVMGYNVRDLYTKRVIKESVIDAVARQTYAIAKRDGKLNGRSKAKFLEDYKGNVPPEIESLAYREMDLWGMDYANVNPIIEKLKSTPLGRALVPYPSYFAKYGNILWEMGHPENVLRAAGVGATSPKQRARAIANLLSLGTMMGAAFALVRHNKDELPDEISEQDLPLEVQHYGRSKIPAKAVPWADEKDGYWVRLMDLPFIGEAMAADAIWAGDMNVGDYINDRLALGPLYNLVSIMAGLVNRYNKDMPPGAALGREVAGWFPMHAEGNLVRRLVDPLKRKPYDETDKSYMRNFARGFAEQYPILSSLLRPRVSAVRLKAATYQPGEALMSYGLLNIHAINEDERAMAVKLAEASKLDDQIKLLRDDQIERYVTSAMNSSGWTLAGEIKTAGKLEKVEGENELLKKQTLIRLLKAFRDDGFDGALAAAREVAGKEQKRPGWPDVAEAMDRLLKGLEKREKAGVAFEQWEKAPHEVQEKYRERVMPGGKIPLKKGAPK